MNYNTVLQDIRKGDISNLYLFFGQEQYLCKELIKQLENSINPSFKELNSQTIEGEIGSFEVIENACETLPFMDDRRLIIIKNHPYLQSGKSIEDEGVEKLIEYLKRMALTTSLIFWQKDLDKRKKLYHTISKKGIVVDCQKLKPQDFHKWIARSFEQRERSIEKEALHYFVENCDYLSKNSVKGLDDIQNEINKIIDYIGEDRVVQKKDITHNLPVIIENDIFKLVDAIGKKDRITALKLLNDLILQGENEIKILSLIARQFRILNQCKELNEMGYSPSRIASRIKEAPFVVNKGISQSRYFDSRSLKLALNSALDADKKIKGGMMDKRLALEMLIFQNTKG